MRLLPTTTLLMIAAWVSICCTQNSSRSEKEADVIVFRNSDGRTLSLADLEGFTGTVRYEILGHGDVPVEAAALHKRAREAGSRGDYQTALSLLERASELAPQWPYPVYDRAFTHLLMEDFDAARTYYKRTIELAPRGFFTAITAVDALTREEAGDLPLGTYLEFLSLEWIDDPVERHAATRAFAKKVPNFAPAWKELLAFEERDDELLAIIEKGLGARPDADTRGILLINKAMVLNRKGDHDGAVRLLGELALDPLSTSETEQLSKATLAVLLSKQ